MLKTANPPLISVVIPTWNGEAHLEKTLDSLFSQSIQNYEVILCDDASTDSTPEIIRRYQGDRVKTHFFDENTGLAGNWNRGVTLATGEYIKLLCQDDLLHPNSLERMSTRLSEDPGLSLVCSFEKRAGSRSDLRKLNDFPALGKLNGKEVQRHILYNGNWIGAPSAVMFRRGDLKKTGLFDSSLPCGLDWEMWLRLLSYGDLFVIPELLYSCRIHGGQESNRCEEMLGFKKDRIRILRKIEVQPHRYGVPLLQKEQKMLLNRSVRKLLSAALHSPHTSVQTVFSFLLKEKIPAGAVLQALPAYLGYWKSVIRKRFALLSSEEVTGSDLPSNRKNRGVSERFPPVQGEKRPFELKKGRVLVWSETGLKPLFLIETPHYQWICSRLQKRNELAETRFERYLRTFYPEWDTQYLLQVCRSFLEGGIPSQSDFQGPEELFGPVSVVPFFDGKQLLFTGIMTAAALFCREVKSVNAVSDLSATAFIEQLCTSKEKEKLKKWQ